VIYKSKYFGNNILLFSPFLMIMGGIQFFLYFSLYGWFSDWVSFLAYPNLFGIKGFVVVVVVLTIWVPIFQKSKKI
jgi:Trk-type K+ transport system membrane component